MSFAFAVLTILLGSSMAIAFVLQPLREEPADFPVSQHRCQSESLESIRKAILKALNLQVEPQLPAGGLDDVRQQWRNTFDHVAHRANDAAISSYSVSPDSTGLKCCSLTSEIFMRDLGWDSWVIHPASLTIVHCALCNPEANTVQCPSSHTNAQGAESQVPCCHPATEEMVPVVYVDESNTLVISSIQLTRSCACGLGNPQLHSPEYYQKE